MHFTKGTVPERVRAALHLKSEVEALYQKAAELDGSLAMSDERQLEWERAGVMVGAAVTATMIVAHSLEQLLEELK